MPARARRMWSKSELARQTCIEQLIGAGNRQMVNVRQDIQISIPSHINPWSGRECLCMRQVGTIRGSSLLFRHQVLIRVLSHLFMSTRLTRYCGAWLWLPDSALTMYDAMPMLIVSVPASQHVLSVICNSTLKTNHLL